MGLGTLAELAWNSSYGTSTKCAQEFTGIAVLRIPNVRGGQISAVDLKFAPDHLDLKRPDLVAPGDLLIIRTNGSEDLIGRGGVVLEPLPAPSYFASYLIRFRLLGTLDLWKWLGVYFESPPVRHWMMEQIASSAGQYNVSQSILAGLQIPLPPPKELSEILRRITDALSAAGDTRTGLHAGNRNTAALRQSVLKAAFEGRLVPQDAADEPAAMLLARHGTDDRVAPRAHRRHVA